MPVRLAARASDAAATKRVRPSPLGSIEQNPKLPCPLMMNMCSFIFDWVHAIRA